MSGLRLYAACAAVVVALVALAGIYATIRKDAAAAAASAERGRIEKENRDAGETAEKWRDALARCRDAGGLFDFGSGACSR